MRRVRELLRYRFEQRMSEGRIAGALGVSKGTVHNTLGRFERSGLVWPLPEGLADDELERLLYPSTQPQQPPGSAPLPDVAAVEQELRRPHVTLELLWREYQQQWPTGMSRASYYRYVAAHLPKPVDMKMLHKGGDELFVDFCGDKVEWVDRATGEVHQAPVFVACWGASSYTFVGAAQSQSDEDLARMQSASLEYFGCAPHALVPDNTRSAVSRADRYEPQMNPLYQKLAEHYGAVVLPARVRKPKDKAAVESAVGYTQRYVLGRLRNRRFFSVAQINEAIGPLVEQLNAEPMHSYGGQTRRQRFEALDRPYAQALPQQRFQICSLKLDATVAPNYHVRFEDHYYSVPHHLARQKVDIHQVGNLLEIYHNGLHLVRYVKQPRDFDYTTIPEHMPPNHAFVRGWSKEWFERKAAQIGPCTAETVRLVMEKRRHPQQGFNSAMGVLNLSRKYTPQRVEAACRRALHFRAARLSSIRTILEQGLDSQPLEHAAQPPAVAEALSHDNLRGATYFAGPQDQAQLKLTFAFSGE